MVFVLSWRLKAGSGYLKKVGGDDDARVSAKPGLP